MTSFGYSGKPLIAKLGLKPGMVAVVLNSPQNYSEIICSEFEITPKSEAVNPHFVHLFVTDREKLSQDLYDFLKIIDRSGMVWVSWPKKSSKVPTNIDENVIREICLPMGWVDVKVCAVNEVWSGLKLVIRKELR